MPVRGTSAWQHAKIERYVINLDIGGYPMTCMWDDCDKRAFENYKYTECRHDVRESCQVAEDRAWRCAGTSAHCGLPFCSQRHRDFFVNATGVNAHESIARTGRAYGNLPVGLRRRIG